MQSRVLLLACTILVWGSLALAQRPSEPSGRAVDRIKQQVRHELLMLPYLDVFDNLAYKVDGYNVTLMGQVTRPTLKSDAENVVKRIEGWSGWTIRLRFCRHPRRTTAFESNSIGQSMGTSRCKGTH
jgi:hypothetical protein